MSNNGLHKVSSSKKLFIGVFLLLGFFFNCRSFYTDYEYQKLEGVAIGNGLSINPNRNLVLISKPSQKLGKNGKPLYRIYQIEYKNDNWSCEKEVFFSSQFNDYHPVFSPDGHWLYFNSDRPIPTTFFESDKMNIWRVSYNNNKWGTPEYLEKINTENHESYPSISKNGSMYFNSDREGGKGSMDIYKSEFKDGNFSTPRAIVELNSKDSENDMAVDPKEHFIIFNRYMFKDKEIELFISENKNGIWSEPRPINSINKDNVWELTPTISPDGKYFLYEIQGKIKVQKLNTISNIEI